MKNFYLIVFFLTFGCPAFSQSSIKLDSWHLGTSLSFINEPQLKTGVGFNTGVAVQVVPKLNGIVNVEYMFASSIKPDDVVLRVYNPNKSLSYVRIDVGLEKTIFKVGNLDFAVSTSLALRKRNEAFASVFYKQFPLEQTPRLVSETVYSSMWQLGDITSLKARFNLKKMFVGINGNYQLFSKNSFLSSGVFTGINF
ncbi:hypothetical protein [uncultured Mucilaginibacter sp.]|uniref:hypothetical protein n=1 Tax=uncultured Mucilaginibacter sp. TaxID=797541 RepID=UPI002632606F|nr:hypothetical protein [uncultured Mucilaginibacter sp.]